MAVEFIIQIQFPQISRIEYSLTRADLIPITDQRKSATLNQRSSAENAFQALTDTILSTTRESLRFTDAFIFCIQCFTPDSYRDCGFAKKKEGDLSVAFPL